MISFTDVLKSEISKSNKTWNFTIALLFPIIITVLVFVYYAKNSMDIIDGGGMNHWINFGRYIINFYQLLYPLLAAVIAFSLSNIEHKNNGLKLLFTLPTSKFFIYFSKVTILLFWLFSSILVAYSLLIISGNLLSFLFPELGFQDYDMNAVFQAFFIRTFITLIAIIAIHFFLSIYWNNFIVSVGSACFLVILGMIISKWKYSYLIPYSNLTKSFGSFFARDTEILTQDTLWSIGLSILFFGLGYFSMIKKDIK